MRRVVGVALVLVPVLVLAALVQVTTIGPRVTVRWRDGVGEERRLALEAQYQLRLTEPVADAPTTYRYELRDWSRENIARLVRDPGVADTGYIDRDSLRTDGPRVAWSLTTPSVSWLWENDTERGGFWRRYAGQSVLLIIVAAVLFAMAARRFIKYLPRQQGPASRVASIHPPVARRGVESTAFRVAGMARGDRTALLRVLLLGAVSIGFAIVFCRPLLQETRTIGTANDWDQHLLYHWAPYETVSRYGEVPLWNPWLCGGTPMLANPQSRWMSPFFFLHLWLGPERALWFEILAHVALAWLGAFWLGRTAGLSRVAALAPAVVFAGCSAYYLHVAEGHTWFFSYAYLPSILAAAVAARPLVAGALLALTIGEGGIYPAPHAVLALCALALFRCATERRVRAVWELALTAGLALCLAAPKLLVVLEMMTLYPRLTPSTESMSPALLLEALFSREQDIGYAPEGMPYRFHEYGAYLGPIPFILMLAGALQKKALRTPWLILAALGLMLAVGHSGFGEYSLWAMLHRLPIFAAQHVPSRFLVPTVLAFGVLAGMGVDRLRRSGWRWGNALSVALLATATLDAASVGPPNLRHIFEGDRHNLQRAGAFTQFLDTAHSRMYALARANQGAINCYEPLQPDRVVRGFNEESFGGEYSLVGGGRVALREWSPHRIALTVDSSGDNILVVNQNYFSSWRVVEGVGQTVNWNGLLGVRVPEGSQELVVAYRSPLFLWGCVLAGATLVGVMTFGRVNMHSRKITGR